MKRTLLILIFTQILSAAPVSLLSFQFGKVGSLVGNSISPIAQFSWTPRLETTPISGRGELGITLYKDAAGIEHPVINADIFAGWAYSFIMFEAGGGLQWWTSSFGLCPDIGGNLVFLIPHYLDRIFVGYSYVFASAAIHQIKIGIALKF